MTQTLSEKAVPKTLLQKVMRKTPLDEVGKQVGGGDRLARTIGLFQLTMLGVGCTVGTGIFFVLTTEVPNAGPSIIFSFIAAAVVAGLTALCYAELASSIPVSGSSYSYAYATLGEGTAMIVAACLLLEYGVSCAAVAVGWSQYVNQLMQNLLGFQIPDALAFSPEDGGIINLPAMVLVLLCMVLLIRGASESARANAIMVCVKLTVLMLFVVVGITGWNTDNLADFAPFGVNGIWVATGGIFFSFIGLDAVSTAGEEVKDPQRTMPRAIILGLIIVSTIYVLVAVVAVAAQPWKKFDGQEAGLAQILQNVTGSAWPGTVIAAGAIISIFSVTLVTLYGQTRILFAMSRDGMVSPMFHKVSPRTLTPVNGTIVVAVVVALLAGLIPLSKLADLTSIGTLTAFSVVSAAVIILRHTAPDLPRGFRVPFYPWVPIASIIFSLLVVIGLPVTTFVIFGVWVAAWLVFYLLYGIRHSRLGGQPDEGSPRPQLTGRP